MAATFSRTLRSLQADGPRRRRLVWPGAALLAVWAGWFVFGRVTLYEASETARLEVASSPHPVAAPVAGRVVSSRLTLGRPVERGEVLLVLDSEAEHRAVVERQVRVKALRGRREVVLREIEAEGEALAAQERARAAALQEAAARQAAAREGVAVADREDRVNRRLVQTRAVSEMEYHKGAAAASAARATMRAETLAAGRLEQDRLAGECERRVRLAKLEREKVELAGEAAAEEAAVRRLTHEIELRTLRAPVGGRLGEVKNVQVGAVVRVADPLGTIIPEAAPRAVAWFPAAAVGRLHGQKARLQLEGFAQAQYGTVPATVRDVGNEASEGRVRVELDLRPDEASAIPREHGLEGAAEVAVESVSPAVLLLRAAGRLVTK